MKTRTGPGWGGHCSSCGGISRVADFRSRQPGWSPAFSLLEVMIALAIFFMAIFAILQSVSQSLASARLLQQRQRVPDVSGLIADLYLTNKFEEGIVEGQFDEPYASFTWTRETQMIATNGLFRVDFSVQGMLGNKPLQSTSSILMWRPESPAANSIRTAR